AAWNLKPSPPPAVVARFPLVVLPEDQFFTNLTRQLVSISPDGTKLAYVASGQLYLRPVAEMEARPIAGAGRASSPFFSPDGQWVGFWSSSPEAALKKIAVTGGAPITISKADQPFGVTWDGDDIVFSNPPKGILRVSPIPPQL